MPSSSRPTRSVSLMPITLCSSACAGLCSLGPPKQTASHARPFEMTSRLAHCCASKAGWRCGKVAIQPTANRTFFVIAASAERRAMDSKRGLARRLSPTHTASNAPEFSPRRVMSKSSGTVTAPMMTPRLANVNPNEAIFCTLLPGSYSIRHRRFEAKSALTGFFIHGWFSLSYRGKNSWRQILEVISTR